MRRNRLAALIAGAGIALTAVFGTAAPASAVTILPSRMYSTDGGAMMDQIKVSFSSSTLAHFEYRLTDIFKDGRIPNSSGSFIYSSGSILAYPMTCPGGYNTSCFSVRSSTSGAVRNVTLRVCNAGSYCTSRTFDNPYN
jgi:hypothetical protein